MEQKVTTVGLDLAKNVFQVHAIGVHCYPTDTNLRIA
jgi:hypothetical protein